MNLPNKSLLPTFLACATAVISIGIAASAYKNRNRGNDLLSVTGFSKRDFDSDLIVWSGSFSRRAPELRQANEALKKDGETIRNFIQKKGLNPASFVFSAVDIEKEFEEVVDREGNRKRTFRGYLLTQRVQVESSDIDSIERFSREVTDLLQSGIEFASSRPQYYYTQLGKLKIEMIAAATKDGKDRAEKIVENAGGQIGKLRYSSLGVFQITAQNSNENPSWSGSFDTDNKRKSASVTIKLQFGLE